MAGIAAGPDTHTSTDRSIRYRPPLVVTRIAVSGLSSSLWIRR